MAQRSASVEEKSQATQLLAQLLESQTESDGNQVQARSSDSFRRNTVPAIRYHTSGLGQTQTESQFSGEDYQMPEGSSQKENMDDSSNSNHSIPTLSSNKAPATKNTLEASVLERKSSQLNATKGPPLHASKILPRSSLLRGRGNNSLPLLTKKRSPSQDSFIGPESNPAEIYVATSRHFNIPLSQLGNTTQDSQRSMHRIRSGPQFNPNAGNYGTILVDDTPPNSGGESQSQSQERTGSHEPQNQSPDDQLEDESYGAQPRDQFDLDFDSHGQQQLSSQSSSQPDDQLKFWEEEADRYKGGGGRWEPTQEATQEATQQATQSTQPEQSQSDPVSIEWDNIVTQLEDRKVQIPGLLAGVLPHQRHKYLHRLRELLSQSASNDGSNRTTGQSNQPTSVAEASAVATDGDEDIDDWEPTQVATQPGVDTQEPIQLEDESHLVPGQHPHHSPPCPKVVPRPDDMEPTQVVIEQSIQSCSRRQLPAPKRTKSSPVKPPCELQSDAMDIIPDSEPAIASPQRTPTEPPNPKVRPAKKELNSAMDIVPDSEEFRASSPLTEEDDDDEEEEEAPLATRIRGGKKVKGDTSADKMPPPTTVTRKGRGKATAATTAKEKGKAATTPVRNVSPAVAKSTGRRTTRRMHAEEEEVVPSSVPKETPEPKRLRRKAAAKTPKAPTPGPSNKKRHHPTIKEEPELEDDDNMTEVTADEYSEPTPSSNKRKRRGNTVESVASTTSKATRTPRRRPPKNPKRMVFALSKSDGHYFAGTLTHCESTGNYVVQFADKSTASLTVDHIRKCDLRLGDEILWEDEMIGWTVKGLEEDAAGNLVVTAELDGVRTRHYLSDIRIAMQTIESQWDGRKLDVSCQSIVSLPRKDNTQLRPSNTIMTPSKDLGPKQRPEQFLKQFAIVMTLPNEEDFKHLSDVGAALLNSWEDAIAFPIERVEGHRAWYMKKEDVRWINKDATRIFLVANASFTTPKYLMALALGVPCVSATWLAEMVAERGIKDWSQYLLPQGFSETLKIRTSQLVDMDWGNSPEHTKNIIDNRAPAKLFAHCNILCEQPRTILDNGSKGFAMIILAMGAKYVEVVNLVGDRSNAAFDFVVYLKRSQIEVPVVDIHVNGEALWDGRKVQCRSWGWVRESLIANRLLPPVCVQAAS
ncbi:dna damage repair protein [Moniliophthora roreri]|nr:dna damage repair protein [Moniliophthora roreri]